MNSNYESTHYSVLESLRERFGDLLTLDDLVTIYKYPTLGAARKAFSRGTLPVSLYRFPKKNGFYAKVEDVAHSIENMNKVSPV